MAMVYIVYMSLINVTLTISKSIYISSDNDKTKAIQIVTIVPLYTAQCNLKPNIIQTI